MRMSVLDQSPAAQGCTQDVAIRESLALAQRCDELGYHRYWVSEHHNSGSIVGTAPEVLMAAIAATTRRIRVGSAGVMLPHYSALKVAEQFRVLEAHRARAHRPRRGPRAGLGPADRARAQPARQRGRRVSAAGARAAVLGRGHAVGGRSPVPQRSPRSRRGRPVPRSGFSAAPITGRGSPRISACRTRSPISSATARASTRRSRSIGATTGPARAIPRRSRRSACGRSPPTPKPKRGGCLTTREFWRVRLRAGPAPSAGLAGAGGRASVHRRRSARGSTSCAARRSSAPRSRWPRASPRSRSASSSTELVVNTWTFDPGRAPSLVRAAGGGVRARKVNSHARRRRPGPLARQRGRAARLRAVGQPHHVRVRRGARRRARPRAYAARGGRGAHGGRVGAHHRRTGHRARHRRSGACQRAVRRSTPRRWPNRPWSCCPDIPRTTSRDAARSRRCGRPRWRRP